MEKVENISTVQPMAINLTWLRNFQKVISFMCMVTSTNELKMERHANIPVLGDSESVISTEYDEKINADCGNIDCISTHQKIVDIMEGGKEAFERRKLIYTNWYDAIQS